MVARIEIIDRTVENTANCLMLLSRVGQWSSGESRVFRCKTCMKEFSSFQALGGHRASHKKSISNGDDQSLSSGSSTKKVKTLTSHTCPICGVEFPMGQALGGHMRKHRNEKDCGALVTRSLLPESTATLKKLTSGKRVACLDLGLDSTENLNLNLELGLGISIY